MTQLETQSENLVNSDVLLQEYESKLEEAVDYMDNEDVTMGEKALVIGEALYNIRQHLSDKDWNQWRKNHPRYNKTSLYDMKRYYEITLSIPAGRNVGYTKMTSLFSLKDNLEDFMSKYDVINMSREQIRQAKKEYKGESANSSSDSEDNGKDTIDNEEETEEETETVVDNTDWITREEHDEIIKQIRAKKFVSEQKLRNQKKEVEIRYRDFRLFVEQELKNRGMKNLLEKLKDFR
jgi:predicted transglutaminase-like protease